MPSKILVAFILITVLMLPTSAVFGQVSEPIVVDPTGQKKIRYIIIDGGGNSGQDEKFIDQQIEILKGFLEGWAKKAKAGSDVTPLEDKTEEKIKEEIKKVGNSLEDGDELVIFYVGHGNVNTGAWFLYDSNFMPAGEITAEELRDTVSGFKKITISIISYSCFGGKLEQVVKEAKDKDGEKYGDNIRVIGPDRIVGNDQARGLRDFPKVFAPLEPTRDGQHPSGDKNGGFFTTQEFVEALKQILKDFFKPTQEDDIIDGACPLFDGIVVGGKPIPIETASLVLAGAQSYSWIIPIVLSTLGIGLLVIRKSKNS